MLRSELAETLRADLEAPVAVAPNVSESLAAAGFSDEQQLTTEATIDFSDVHGEHKPWKDIFGVGQGVGAILEWLIRWGEAPSTIERPSARRVSWLLLKEETDLELEEQGFLDFLIAGATPGQITALFLGSQEFLNRQLTLLGG